MTAALTDAARERFAATAQLRRFDARRTLFREGDASDRVFLLVSGRVKVFNTSEGGQEVVLAVRGAGDLIGELSVIDGHPRSATAMAMDAVQAYVMDQHAFTRFLVAEPDVAVALLRMMAGRLRAADRTRLEFASFDVVGRVARRLLALADEHGEPVDAGVRIAIGLTQGDLASFTGSSREAVSRALQQLRESGVVSTGRGEIVIHDLAGLAAHS